MNKILFLVVGIAELAIELIKAKYDPEDNIEEQTQTHPIRPYNVFGTGPTRGARARGKAASEASWSYLEEEETPPRAPQTPSSPPPIVKTMGSRITDPKILELVGPAPMCSHMIECYLYQCHKQGYNLDRLFWRCPMVMENQCGSFVWTHVQPWWEVPAKNYPAASTSTPSPTPTEASMSTQRRCPHTRTTKKGTNAHVDREVCRDCGKVLRHDKKDGSSQSEASNQATSSEAELDMAKEYEAFRKWYQKNGKK